MTEVTFRDATTADAAAIAELARATFVATFGHLYAPADLASFLDVHTAPRWQVILASGSEVRLAESGGGLIGYARIDKRSMPYDPGDRVPVELRQLYVRDDWHGTGIAVTLMDWVIAAARARGADDLWLSVFVDNQRARRFYARYGFVEVMPYRFVVGNHVDNDIICRLALDQEG